MIKRFLARKFSDSRSVRLELRLYPEQRAAYERAALVEGDADVSAWARRRLDASARVAIEGAK